MCSKVFNVKALAKFPQLSLSWKTSCSMAPQFVEGENQEKSPIGEKSNGIKVQDEITKLTDIGTDLSYKHKIVWKNVIILGIYDILGLIGITMILRLQVNFLTVIYTCMVYLIGTLGLSMGVHRYFSHRSFKATPTFRRILHFMFAITGQASLWRWVREHRQHHKYSDTDADPHNSKRGFFFSYLGWCLTRRNPKIFEYSKNIDMSDMKADSWVMFEKKYYFQTYIVVAIFIPCVIPIILWNEDAVTSFFVCFCARTVIFTNITLLTNALLHSTGTKPYDKFICPGQNKFVSIVSLGEGWHNYHHIFPWDYRSAEVGMYLNFTTTVIDFCSKFGWIYDLKAATKASIENRIKKTGDNSYKMLLK